MARVHCAPTRDLDVATLHDILRLRQDVFVVEQQCLYADVDGRDLESGTVQVWAVDEQRLRRGDAAGAARPRGLPRGSGGWRRRSGPEAAAWPPTSWPPRWRCAPRPVVLDAQSHLEGWYARFGFVRTGEEFLDDGIPHVPMRLDR